MDRCPACWHPWSMHEDVGCMVVVDAMEPEWEVFCPCEHSDESAEAANQEAG